MFGVLATSTSRNLGDDIQSYAASLLLPARPVWVERDSIAEEARPVRVIGAAYWAARKSSRSWPPPANVDMLPISMHVDRSTVDGGREWLLAHQPIGCRDTDSVELLRSEGIEAYFSGCITLTLDRHDGPRSGKVTAREVAQILPRRVSCDPARRRRMAIERLAVYRAAALVITSRVHVALPCVAMGTPVQVLRTNHNRARLSGYDWIPDRGRCEELAAGIRERVSAWISATR